MSGDAFDGPPGASEGIPRTLGPPICRTVGGTPRAAAWRGGGLSGARLWRLQYGGRAWCLRAWPPGTPWERVAEVHRVMRAARAGGCEFVPRVYAIGADGAPGKRVGDGSGTVAWRAERAWELSDWMPGRAWGESPAPAEVLVAAVETLARFHTATRALGQWQQPAPAVEQRLRRMAEIGRLVGRIEAGLAGRVDWLGQLGREALDAWRAEHGALEAALRVANRTATGCQYVLRDVHREHVLFDAGRATGLVDYDAVRVDTPATDLARLVGSLAGADEARFGDAVAAYHRVRTLSSWEVESVAVLDRATTLLAAMTWLQWALLDRHLPGGPDAARARLGEHVNRLLRNTGTSRSGARELR